MTESSVDRSKRIANNTLYLFFRMLLVAIVSLYTSRVILSALGVSDFGIYNVVGSVVVFASFFKNALTNATYRYLAYEIGIGNFDQLKKLFSMSINVHCILAVILFVFLEIIGSWVVNNKLNIPIERLDAANFVFHFSLITFCLEVIKTPYNSLIIAKEEMSFYAIISILEVLLKLLIVYLLCLFSFDKLMLYAALLMFVSLVIFLCYLLFCWFKYPESHYKYYWNNSLLKTLLSYSGWSMLVNTTDVSVTQCISIFLNLFYGVVANAAMGIANQVNALLNSLLSSFSTAFTPQIIKSYAGGEKNYFMKLLFSTSKLSFFALFALAFPIMLNIEYILQIWLKNPPELAGKFLICIACYTLFDSFSSPLWNAVHATGNIKVHQILMSSIKILNIPIGYLLLYKGYSAVSILLLYAILNGVCSLVRIIYLKYLIDLDYVKFFKDVILKFLVVIIISIILPLIIKYLNISNIFTLVASSLSFFSIYGFVVYFIGLNLVERDLLKNIIFKKIIKK